MWTMGQAVVFAVYGIANFHPPTEGFQVCLQYQYNVQALNVISGLKCNATLLDSILQ